MDRDTISAEHNGRGQSFYLFFSVRDSGIGIPKDKQKTIFDSFAQADGARSGRYGGNGLGLAVAKQMLALMGGTIGVESEPGTGSRFWFSMPTGESEDSAATENRLRLPNPLASL